MEELYTLWQKVTSKIQNYVSAVTFDVWISKVEPIELKNTTLVLCAQTTIAKNLILKNHMQTFRECIQEVFGDYVNFIILDREEKEAYLKENSENKSEIVKNDEPVKKQFNEKYTFDNFVVGNSNRFCYAAAHSVAENPGTKFNPLFIYSGVGLGKTHLMHAIGNYITEHSPELKIKYVTCENFMNEYIESLGVVEKGKEKAIFEFREKYRNVDVLMIDDIQFIENRNATKEEFFHTFNDLFQNNKQIIISSDRSPKNIDIEDRLKSRFASGLIQDMQIPDFETKMAILKKKAQIERMYLDDEVLSLIADKPFTSIREMEGMLSKVFFYAQLMGNSTATKEDALRAFQDDIEEKEKRLTPDMVINQVCKYFEISSADIKGKRKTKEIVEPRMIAIYLIDEMFNLPQDTIGEYFGGRDHSTIIHSRDKIAEQMKRDNKLRLIINDLKAKISE